MGPADQAAVFIDAYNDRDWDRLAALLAPGCVYQEIGRPRRRVEGSDEVTRIFQGWATAVPELRGEIVHSVGGENAAALELDWRGALAAPFGDYAPAGQPPRARAALFFAFADGLINEMSNYYDSLALYQVLGIGP